MLLCLPALAAASGYTVHFPEAERIQPGLPQGMVAKVELRGNYLDIEIDTHATDWDMVATAAKKSGSLTIHPGIEAPKDSNGNPAVKGEAFSTDIARWNGESLADAENRVISSMIGKPLENVYYGTNGTTYGCSYQGWSIGNYDEGTGLFLPYAIEQGWASFAVCWRMNDDSLRVERMRFNVRFTDPSPVYTSRRNVKDDDIKTGVAMNEWSLTGNAAKADVEDGRVVYHLGEASVGKEIHTAIAAPYKAEWTEAYLLSNGKEKPQTLRTGSYFSGKPYIVTFYKIDRSDVLDKKDWAVKWVAKDGTVAVTGLEAVIQAGDPQFTVSYPYKNPETSEEKAGASAVPNSRLRYEIRNPLDGLDVSITNGHIHMSVDEDKLPSNRKTDLSQTTMSAQVFVPEKAKSFDVYLLRGDVIYGNWGEWQNLLAEDIPAPAGEWMNIADFTDRSFFKAHNVILHNGKYMTYYVAPTPVGRYGGETLVFEWTMKDGTAVREYVALTIDAYQIRRNPSETMNPNHLVKIPTVQANKRMAVETAILPQMGENVIRHEITLYDNDGNKQELKQPVALYLPYPDGKTMEECKNDVFVVYHQVGRDEYEEFSVEKGNLTLTQYGLLMEVTSFSPYILSWETAPDSSALPQTGDRSKLALWLLLAAGTLAGGMSIKKKKAA